MEVSEKQIAQIADGFWKLDRILNYKVAESLNMTDGEAIRAAYDSLRTALSELGVVDRYGNVRDEFKVDHIPRHSR